jgi:hypothetical protein
LCGQASQAGDQFEVFRFDKENVVKTIGTLCAIIKNVQLKAPKTIETFDPQNFADAAPE